MCKLNSLWENIKGNLDIWETEAQTFCISNNSNLIKWSLYGQVKFLLHITLCGGIFKFKAKNKVS